MAGQRKHYSVQIDERMPSYPTPEPVLSFRACNTYGVCVKSFLLQEEILKTMKPRFQAPEQSLYESREREMRGNASQVNQK